MRLAIVLGLLAVAGCKDRSASPDAGPEGFAAPIERAHNLAAWRSRGALRARVELESEGEVQFDGRFVFDTPVGKSRVEVDDLLAVFDGKTAWVSPADAEFPMARFHLLTWPYFIAAATKLSDPGSHLTPIGERRFAGKSYPAAKLTFDAGVGDTPKDWYVVYRERASDRLRAMAYVVTYGRSVAEAESKPYVVSYDEWTVVEGVLLPTKAAISPWSEQEGAVGEPETRISIRDYAFVPFDPKAFEKPKDAREERVEKTPER